jgi:hypothetical protein
MLGSTPSFPSIDRWQEMSEGDQDALIRAIERSRRRRSRLIFGSAGIGICATIALIAYCVL